MTEREIFLDALEREDAAARDAYLDAACSGRPALRRRVEQMLQYHREDTTFLNVPAMEQLAAAEESLAFLGPPAEPGSLGRLDHYEVLEVVGRGATGVVLKARDTKLQRVVAVKALVPRLSAIGAARQRFVREAQAAAAVRDDNVVAIYAVSDDGPVPYLVMEYICGLTLEQRVRNGMALELKEILRIGMQLANGLAAAHAQGLVHRDIKPANILLENGVERVKITDFGLARVAAVGSTAVGALAGTPMYMSPEQARGDPTDHRTDLFSLGSVLYTLCTGQSPFRADTTAGVLNRVRADAPQPIRELNPEVPEWLCDLIGKLHAKEASARPGNAREVADLLGGQLAVLHQPPLAPPSGVPVGSVPAVLAAPRRPGVPTSRRLTVAICLVVLLAALATLAVLLNWWPFGGSEHWEEGETPRGNSGEPLELRREDIPHRLLVLAGGGDPAQAPPELAAVLGDGRFLFPPVGSTGWMDQSPDGKVLAVPLDEDVILFQVPTGDHIRSLKGPGGRVEWVTFSRDSQLLAATTWREGAGGAVRVWDFHADRELYTKPQPGPRVAGAAAFSADGRRLVTEGGDRLQVCDARTGQEVQTVELHSGGIPSLYFSPDGRRLAMAVYGGKSVKVFDWVGEKLGAVRTLEHRLFVGAVAYSPDGKFLASGDESGFKLWNAETLEEIRTVATPAHQLAFAPDSRVLLAAFTNGQDKAVHTLTRWDVVTGEELPPLSVEVSADRTRVHHYLGRDGKVLFVAPGSKATYVRAIDTTTGKEQFPREGHTEPLLALAIAPNGGILASAGEDRTVKLWNLPSKRVRHSLGGHADAIGAVDFTPDGKRLASGSRDGTIIVWNVSSGAEIRTLKGHSQSLSNIKFSPDGQTLAAGADNGTIKVWDTVSGKEGQLLTGHAGAVRCVGFSLNGNMLASGGEDKTVIVHHLADGKLQKFKMPGAVNNVAFSTASHILAAASDGPEAAVRLWDVETGRETALQGHIGHVYGLAFSPSTPLLATCGEDGTVRLWNLTGDLTNVRTIGPGPFGGPVRSVAFTPDGRYLATANANGMVYLLRVEPPSQ